MLKQSLEVPTAGQPLSQARVVLPNWVRHWAAFQITFRPALQSPPVVAVTLTLS